VVGIHDDRSTWRLFNFVKEDLGFMITQNVRGPHI
jgi:hypothetical protein